MPKRATVEFVVDQSRVGRTIPNSLSTKINVSNYNRRIGIENDRVQSLKDSSKFVHVEWRLRKPCWCFEINLCLLRKLTNSIAIIDSSILQQVHVKEMGR